ncbi:MAG: AAA family ATPase [Cyclobacteriaceae bacterium]|nr:AAA family ATPase [Cyclobacteriaceae bacterium SS2]
MDLADHFHQLLDLLKIEREEDRKQYEEKIRNRSLEDRKKEGVTWYPVVVGKSYLSTGEKWTLQLEKTTLQYSKSHFQSGSSVSVFLNDNKSKLSASGIISRISDKYMTVVLNREDPPDWLEDGKIGVNLLFDESTYDEMERAMKKLARVEEGRLGELIRILCGEKAPTFKPHVPLQHPGLNETQNNALSLINATNDIGLVHGPPGTGKTTTLVEAVKETVSVEKQVLVCASSNAAVDLMAERLGAQGIHVLRLGHPARVTDEVVASTLDARIAEHHDAKLLRDLRRKSEEMRSIGKKYKRNFGSTERQQRRLLLQEAKDLKDEAISLENYMIQDELNKAQVIACTLVGSNNTYLQNRTFKTLFIDEASQALEPASWIPIMKVNRVIMAGDHFQLPPTIKSVKAARDGLSETIFERVIRKYDEANVMLETQYRMENPIMQFSNEYFYKGRLKSDDLIKNRRKVFQNPVEFIDTAGCGFEEKLNPETLSTYNEDEAWFLLSRLGKLIREHDKEVGKMDLGIIAPYKAQVEVLNGLMEQAEWKDAVKKITINTVDAFQGQERDIIAISMVRSNPTGEIGFLGDIRRMNVAMTRARYLLLMAGDSSTLSNNDFFDELIRHYQDKQFYSSAFEYPELMNQ